MRFRSTWCTVVALGWMGCAWPVVAQPLEPPRLEVVAPPGLSGMASRLRAYDPARLAGVLRVVGLQNGGGTILVRLLEESHATARSTPSWVVGFARPADSTIVLFPARTPSYPDDSIEELLHHEVAHVLIHRASVGRAVPRWFNEGLAMTAEHVWGLEDRARTALALVRGSNLTLADLGPLFGATSSDAGRAYAMSGAFVRYLFDQFGPTIGARILYEVSRGTSFGESFLLVTGQAVASVEASFWQRTVLWYRWIPFLTSSSALWIAITLLALLAIRSRRSKRAVMRAHWDDEDRVDEDLDDDESSPTVH